MNQTLLKIWNPEKLPNSSHSKSQRISWLPCISWGMRASFKFITVLPTQKKGYQYFHPSKFSDSYFWVSTKYRMQILLEVPFVSPVKAKTYLQKHSKRMDPKTFYSDEPLINLRFPQELPPQLNKLTSCLLRPIIMNVSIVIYATLTKFEMPTTITISASHFPQKHPFLTGRPLFVKG